MEPYRLILAGFGNVGSSFVRLLAESSRMGNSAYEINVVGVAELGGAAASPCGLDLGELLRARELGLPIWSLPGVGIPDLTATELIAAVDADCLLEATPTNLATGAPGVEIARAAVARGWDIVLANKAPLALHFDEFAATTEWRPPFSRSLGLPLMCFSATLAGALPAVMLGRALYGCRIETVEGILNGTSHLVLHLMARGATMEGALSEAQAKGMAEADPSLDLDGWDAAGKLVTLANAVLEHRCMLDDVTVTGIGALTDADFNRARESGRRIVSLARADRNIDGWCLSVAPTEIDSSHALAHVRELDMGISYQSDSVPRLTATSTEPNGVPAAAAVLRDVVTVALQRRTR